MELSIRSWRRPEPGDLPFVNIFVVSAVAHGVLMLTLLLEPTDTAALSASQFKHHWGCWCIIQPQPPPPRVEITSQLTDISPFSGQVRAVARDVLADSYALLRRCSHGETLPRYGTVEIDWEMAPGGERQVRVTRSRLPDHVSQCMAEAIEKHPGWPVKRRHVIEIELQVTSRWDPLPATGKQSQLL